MTHAALHRKANTRVERTIVTPESVKFHVSRRVFIRIAGVLGLVVGSGLHGAFAGTRGRRLLGSPEREALSTPTVVVGVEIGTSKICVAVGERSRDGRVKLLGIGQAPSAGVHKGEIIDRDAVARCVWTALDDAERQSNVIIRYISVGVTGAHIRSFNNIGVVVFTEPRTSISDEDIEATQICARDVAIPAGNDFLHFRLRRYQLDNHICLLDPIGLPGQKLAADFHVIHGGRTRFLRTIRCINQLPLEIEDVIFTALASAQVVLTQDQKEKGALVIDLGAGTTGYVLYTGGAVTQSGMLPIGGDHITNDLSMALRIPTTAAEELKVGEGSVTLGNHPPGENVAVAIGDGLEARHIEREVVSTIIHSRVRETLESLKQRLSEGNFTHRNGECIFLTGGCSRLPGVCALAEEVFGSPARIARVTEMVSGREDDLTNPQLSCAIGLLKFRASCTS